MTTHDATTQATTALQQVKNYHQQTKHEFNRFAKSLGYLDWANQPDPFRRFHGAPLISLPLLQLDEEPFSPSYKALFNVSSIPPQPISLKTISRLFEYALSLTAWKEYNGTRWALRSNPSSGNLHPTEGYLFVDKRPQLSLDSGLYHYAPKEHGLEHRWKISSETAQLLLQHLPTEGFLVGLTSIHWREAWKYGERAFRYCQHDTGHAIGSMRIAAATLGWNMVVLSHTSDETIEQLLGLHRKQDFQPSEREYPELLAAVWPKNISPPLHMNLAFAKPSDEVLLSGEWQGTANRLSKDNPVHWDIIDEVAEASWKSTQESEIMSFSSSPAPQKQSDEKEREPLAGQIIHQRRSAVSFDGQTNLSVDRFYTMLLRTMPHNQVTLPERPMPWDALPWNPTVHLALFVHRIDGLPSGMYWLNRNPHERQVRDFQTGMQEQFVWTTPDNCPSQLPLYLLEEGDAKSLAMQLSCGQEIASDSAFALGMVAEFDESFETFGPWFYKRLFWETGLIGQVLYLEAEAAGIRSTGIGCFFDDPVHRVLGFYPQTKWQSLYHFTVGGPTDDGRLSTLPPYGPHLT
ncbi:MAG: SagB/ThcOx family dehydrogenase [Nitrospirales bacterium]